MSLLKKGVAEAAPFSAKYSGGRAPMPRLFCGEGGTDSFYEAKETSRVVHPGNIKYTRCSTTVLHFTLYEHHGILRGK